MDTSSIPARSPRGSPTPSGRDSPTRAEVPKYTSIYLSAVLRLSPKLTFPSFLPFLVHFLRRSSVPSLRKRTVREGPPPQWALEQQSNGGRGPLPPSRPILSLPSLLLIGRPRPRPPCLRTGRRRTHSSRERPFAAPSCGRSPRPASSLLLPAPLRATWYAPRGARHSRLAKASRKDDHPARPWQRPQGGRSVGRPVRRPFCPPAGQCVFVFEYIPVDAAHIQSRLQGLVRVGLCERATGLQLFMLMRIPLPL